MPRVFPIASARKDNSGPPRPALSKVEDINSTKSAWPDGNEYPFEGHARIFTEHGEVAGLENPGELRAEGIDFTSALTCGYADQLRYKEDEEAY